MEKGFMGFQDFGDFMFSFFGLQYVKFNVIIAAFALITTFITKYIWDTPEAIYTLWILMAFDWLTGIIKSIKINKFSSTRFPRMLVFFSTTSLLIALSWNLAKHSIYFYPLPSLIIGGFYAVYLISLVENLTELNWLPKEIIYIIKKRFGLKSLLKQYDTEHGIEDSEEPKNDKLDK